MRSTVCLQALDKSLIEFEFWKPWYAGVVSSILEPYQLLVIRNLNPIELHKHQRIVGSHQSINTFGIKIWSSFVKSSRSSSCLVLLVDQFSLKNVPAKFLVHRFIGLELWLKVCLSLIELLLWIEPFILIINLMITNWVQIVTFIDYSFVLNFLFELTKCDLVNAVLKVLNLLHRLHLICF